MFGKKKSVAVTTTETPVINLSQMMQKAVEPEPEPKAPEIPKLDDILKDVAKQKGFIDETGKFWIRLDDVLEAIKQ